MNLRNVTSIVNKSIGETPISKFRKEVLEQAFKEAVLAPRRYPKAEIVGDVAVIRGKVKCRGGIQTEQLKDLKTGDTVGYIAYNPDGTRHTVIKNKGLTIDEVCKMGTSEQTKTVTTPNGKVVFCSDGINGLRLSEGKVVDASGYHAYNYPLGYSSKANEQVRAYNEAVNKRISHDYNEKMLIGNSTFKQSSIIKKLFKLPDFMKKINP